MHYSAIVFGLLALSGVANAVPIDENHQGDVTTISVASSLQARGPTSTKATTGKSTTAAASSGTGKATSVAASNTSGKPSSTGSSAAAASTSAGTNSKGNSTTSGGTNSNGNSTTNGGTNSRGNSTVGGATNSTKAGNSTACPRAREPATDDLSDKYIINYLDKDIKTLQKEIQGFKPPQGKCLQIQTSEPVLLVDTPSKKYQIYIGYLDKLIVEEVLNPLKKERKLSYSTATWSIADAEPETVVQETAPWSLARISQEGPLQNLGLMSNRVTKLDWKFPHKADWGKDVLIYVIDTGVRGTHNEFGGRVEAGHTIESSVASGEATTDAHGHGTAVASAAAGKTVGVAREATIVPIKISNSRSTVDSTHLLQALNWVKNDIYHTRSATKAVINASWSIPRTDAAQAIIQVIADVVKAHIIVTAGNEKKNDCDRLITNEKLVAMVGGIDHKDNDVYNYGPCVNIHAPARNIRLAKHDSDDGYKWAHGTSFAAPLVAGAAASELTRQTLTPSQMRYLLESERSASGIQGLRDQTPDRILLTRLAKEPGNAVQ